MVAGSLGVGDIESTAAEIAASGVALPVVACGRNTYLRRRLDRAGTARTLGWVDRMDVLLRGVDVVVQNAGGLSSLEAIVAGTPVLSYRPLPGHGRTNAAALHAAGLARQVDSPQELPAALATALGTPTAARAGLGSRLPEDALCDLVRGPALVRRDPIGPLSTVMVPAVLSALDVDVR